MNAASAPVPAQGDLAQAVRQMLAVLQDERRALAGLDLAGIVDCAMRKGHLCEVLADADTAAIDVPLQTLLTSAVRLNDGNARLRNLIAGKVSTRLTALTGRSSLYRVGGGNAMRARMAHR
jgi:hypothetical protein